MNAKKITSILLLCMFVFLPQFSGSGEEIILKPKVDYAKKHALLVGISKYVGDYAYLGTTPCLDVVDVGNILYTRFGFDVHILVDQKVHNTTIPPQNIYEKEQILPQDIDNLLAEIGSVVCGEDALLFFYAGHGEREGIVCGDGSTKSLASVAKMLYERQARHTLMILDTCYSGTVFSPDSDLKKELEKLPLPEVEQIEREGNFSIIKDLNRPVFQIITAGTDNELVENRKEWGPYSEYFTDNHSPFTHYLLLGLIGMEGNEEGVVRASQLGEYIFRSMDSLQTGKQTPRYDWLQGQGNFLFIPQQPVINPRILAPLALQNTQYAKMWITSCESMVNFIKNSEETSSQETPSLIKTAIPYLDFCLKRNIDSKNLLLNEKEYVPESYIVAAQGIIELIKLYKVPENYFRDIHQSCSKMMKKLFDISQGNMLRRMSREHNALRALEEHCAEIVGRLPILANKQSTDIFRVYVDKLKRIWAEETQKIDTGEREFYKITLPEKKNYYADIVKNNSTFVSFLQKENLVLKQKLEEYTKEIPNLEEQTSNLEQCRKLYCWLNNQGLKIIKEDSRRKRIQHQKGRDYLNAAEKLLKDKKIFESKLMAVQSVAFEGFGGENLGENISPMLMKNTNEWSKAQQIINNGPDSNLLWTSPITQHHNDYVIHMSFNSSGDTLASISWDGTIKIWDVESGAILDSLVTGEAITNAAFHHKTQIAAFSYGDETIKLWNLKKQKATVLRKNPEVLSMAFNYNGQVLAFASGNKTIKMYNIEKETETVLAKNSDAKFVLFHPCHNILASAHENGTITLWDTETQQKFTLERLKSEVKNLSFSANGKHLVSTCIDGTIVLWDVENHTRLYKYKDKYSYRNAVFSALSPDGKMIISVIRNRTVKMWHIETKETTTLFENSRIYFIVFHPDNKTIATASKSGVIKLWDMKKQKEMGALSDHGTEINSLRFSPDGKILASSSDQKIKLWDVRSKKGIVSFGDYQKKLTDMAFSPNNKIFAFVEAGKIKLWYIDQRKIKESSIHNNNVTQIAFNPDSTIIAFIEDGILKFWNMAKPEPEVEIVGTVVDDKATPGVPKILFSFDSKMLVSLHYKTVKFWDSVTKKEIGRLDRDSEISDIALNSTEGILALAEESFIEIFNIEKKEKKDTFYHQDKSLILSVTFSPDGQTIAFTSINYQDEDTNGEINLWNIKKRKKIFSISSDSYDLEFSPDSQTLASSSYDAIELWNIQNKKEINILDGIDLAFEDNKKLVYISPGGTINFWDYEKQIEIDSVPFYENTYWSQTLNHNGKKLISIFVNGEMQLFDIQSEKKWLCPLDNRAVGNSAISPNDKIMACSLEDGEIVLWDIESNNVVSFIKNITHSSRLAFSPNNKILVTSWDEDTIKLWDIESKDEIGSFSGYLETVSTTNFSPDSQVFACDSGEGMVKLWDISKAKEIGLLDGHLGSISSIAFNSNKVIASASTDKIKIWDIDSHIEIASFPVDTTSYPTKLIFSPDGSTLASVLFSDKIVLWDLTKINYAQYLDIYRLENEQIINTTTNNHLYHPKIVFPFFIPRGPHLEILEKFSGREQNELLFLQYLKANNRNSSLVLWQQLGSPPIETLTKQNDLQERFHSYINH